MKNFLEPELGKADIRVIVNTDYPPDIKDMTAMLTRIKRSNPDAVLVLSYPADSVLYARQAKELDLASPFQFIAVGPSAPSFAKAVGASSAQGVVTSAHWVPKPEWPGSQSFYDAYVKKFEDEPDHLNSVLTWVSLEILEDAVAHQGLDKAKIREHIVSTTFNTINGEIRFEGVQNAITPTAFVQIQEGKQQIIWPPSIATALWQPKRQW